MEALAPGFRPKLDLIQRVKRRIPFIEPAADMQFQDGNLLRFLESTVWGRPAKGRQAAGFKLLTSQWARLALDQRKALLSVKGLKIIYLDREDVLSQCVSHEQARLFGVRNRLTSQPMQELPAIDLTRETFSDFLKGLWVQKEFVRSAFSHLPSIETSYERLLIDPDEENKAILNFLGADPFPLKDLTARNSYSPLRVRIANYETFSQSLIDTPLERYLPSK
jgi:hypothetical protein